MSDNKVINKDDIGARLDEKIPRSVVSERDGGGGHRLSYLEGHYVIDRLNKVFGHTGWSNEILDVRQVVNKTAKGEFPAYLVRVRLTVVTPIGNGNFMNIVKEGYGYGCDKSTQNAHELAMKEAVTDALKVAAKNLGMSMGLALYDKTQENVSEEEEKAEETSNTKVVPSGTVGSAELNAKSNGHAKETVPDETDTKKIQEAIKSGVRVAVKLGKLTVESFKTELKTRYGVENLAALNGAQLKEVLSKTQELTGGKNVH